MMVGGCKERKKKEQHVYVTQTETPTQFSALNHVSFFFCSVSLSPQPVGFVSFDSRSEAEAAKNALNVSVMPSSCSSSALLVMTSTASLHVLPSEHYLHFLSRATHRKWLQSQHMIAAAQTVRPIVSV